MNSTQSNSNGALIRLRRSDPVMRDLIARIGPFRLKIQRGRFRVLVRSIISQQISTAAARTIRRRLERMLAPGQITAQRLSQLSVAQLRSVGVSGQKAVYLNDLADKVLTRQVRLNRIAQLSDEQVIDELTQVKGIGRWTAQMFLIFSLGRLDVLPHDDLGVRTAIRNLYQLEDLPDKARCLEIAAPWRPYASVASWYCWRSLDT